MTNVYLAGSLTKRELIDRTLLGLMNSKDPRYSDKSMRESFNEAHLQTIIDELTLDHFLVGVSAVQTQTNAIKLDTLKTKEAEFTKKRDLKKAGKDAIKKEKISEKLSSDTMLLRINFLRFIAWERKLSVVAFAAKKVSSSEDDSVFKVFRALVKFDE